MILAEGIRKKIEEGKSLYRMTHDQNRNPGVFSPSSYELGFCAALDLPELKALVEALDLALDLLRVPEHMQDSEHSEKEQEVYQVFMNWCKLRGED